MIRLLFHIPIPKHKIISEPGKDLRVPAASGLEAKLTSDKPMVMAVLLLSP